MFSDEIHSSYMKIYEAIREYSDYCEVRKKDTIKAMYALYKMIYAFSQMDASDELSEEVSNKILKIVHQDYANALAGKEYI